MREHLFKGSALDVREGTRRRVAMQSDGQRRAQANIPAQHMMLPITGRVIVEILGAAQFRWRDDHWTEAGGVRLRWGRLGLGGTLSVRINTIVMGAIGRVGRIAGSKQIGQAAVHQSQRGALCAQQSAQRSAEFEPGVGAARRPVGHGDDVREPFLVHH